MITIVTILDGDGHFLSCRLNERKRVIELLKLIEDGDYYENMKDDLNPRHFKILLDNEFDSIEEFEWNEFVIQFTERGRCEIGNI